jgi:6-phosphogluconate dehydrogenase
MQLGIVGLGRMGGNIARRLMRAGHRTVVHDRNREAITGLEGEGAQGAHDLGALVQKLKAPRAVWVMLPAGEPTEQTIAQLAELLEPGDAIIDGGNTFYKDDMRRAAELAKRGLHYLDVGTSGGVWGLDRGYCMMIGGEKEVFERLEPLFKALAPGVGDIPRTQAAAVSTSAPSTATSTPAHRRRALREDGAQRHRVRPDAGLCRRLRPAAQQGRRRTARRPALRPQPDRDRRSVASWQRGHLLAAGPDRRRPGCRPTVVAFSGSVSDSGEGRWTIDAAVEQAVPVPVLSSALFARFRSRQQQGTYGDKILSAMRLGFGGHVEKKGE